MALFIFNVITLFFLYLTLFFTAYMCFCVYNLAYLWVMPLLMPSYTLCNLSNLYGVDSGY